MAELVLEKGLSLFEPKADLRFQIRQIGSEEAGLELENIAFDAEYRNVAEKKFHHRILKAYDLSAPAANILKQTCLSLGAEAGVHRGAINCTIEREAVLITATQAQLEKLVLKLRSQPFGLKDLAQSITRLLQRHKYLLQRPTQAMAILNITPDSFSDGGHLHSIETVMATAGEAIDHGAKILDIGGESTRPGAKTIPAEIEQQRVIPIIQALHREFPDITISIDTRKAAVAKEAIAAGATLINDVSGLTFDPEMTDLVVHSQCPVILMHSQGDPETMQTNPVYQDMVGEISTFFYRQVAGLIDAGYAPENIMLDPGFGFGKTLSHNMELMRRLPELVSIGFPLVVGTSRKSFLTLGDSSIGVNEREALTSASLAVAIQAGARIVRIHDIKTQMPVIQWLMQLETGRPL
jgi:dihydropteroate synthase